MRSQTLYREITAAGILLASYPLAWIAERTSFAAGGGGEPVILVHGLGGNRANLLGLAAYVRMAGFRNIRYFQYRNLQSVTDSAERLANLVSEAGSPVHLIGHSLGGTIARRFCAGANSVTVRSLITLASPYRYEQHSPGELAIFGEEDPVVPPPLPQRLNLGAFERMVVLPSTGHLGILYHAETLRLVESELTAKVMSRP
jgi:pimeloyl-ACP methyl ester carboxylesterase